MENESWAPTPGWEGFYEVSNHGRVRRSSAARGAVVGRILKLTLCKGYPCVMLCRDSKMKNHRVHQLVAKAFLPPREGCNCVNHKDGNRANNHISNLEWCTPAENSRHARDVLGRQVVFGSQNGKARLNEEKAVQIKERLRKGHRKADIARDFHVHPNTIHAINRGITWAHVEAA